MTPNKPKRIGGNQVGFTLIFGIIWLLFSCPFFLYTLGEGTWGGTIILGIFVLVGLAVTGSGLRLLWMRRRVGTPTIMFSQTTLKVGQSFTIDYEHTLRSRQTVERLAIELIFREVATYQQGTDTRTVTQNHIIDAFEQPGGSFSSGHTLREHISWTIPADGMHTLDVRRNKLKWVVKLMLELDGLPDYVDEYELIVTPTVAERP